MKVRIFSSPKVAPTPSVPVVGKVGLVSVVAVLLALADGGSL